MRATERAFPWPLSAPSSARRQAGVFAAAASATGPVKVLYTGLSGSRLARSKGSGGGGVTGAIRSQSASIAPIWKSAPSGPAISSATKVFRGLPLRRRTSSPTRWPWFCA